MKPTPMIAAVAVDIIKSVNLKIERLFRIILILIKIFMVLKLKIMNAQF